MTTHVVRKVIQIYNRVRLTTDGLKVFPDAVEGAFGADVDYARLVKIYGDVHGPNRFGTSNSTSLSRWHRLTFPVRSFRPPNMHGVVQTR